MLFSSTCCACDRVDIGEETFTQQVLHDPQGDPQGDRAPESGVPQAAAEKSRLQEFVKDFAKCAVRGVHCRVVDSATGNAFHAAYSVDASLRRLILRSDASNDLYHRNLEMSRIKDVYDFESATEVLPEAVTHAIGGSDTRDRFLAIVFADGSEPVCILEASVEERDRFIMCVKILRLYAQTHGTQSGEGGAEDVFGG
mmetsp:Transcript_40006/g.87352  ORF Transcript_40006/g.87352 Transcript_40006/m.87352 type:complete len:198 (+) Transcript_40006:54-647(+)